MNKEYRYRKHIRWGQYLIPALFIFLIIILWGVALFVVFMKGIASKALIAGVPLFSFLLILEGSLLWYIYYRMAGIRVSVGEDALIYRNRRGEKNIPFDAISCLKFPSIPYTGGWIKIISKSNTIRLTVVLQNIGDFLQELKNALDHKGLCGCYDRRKFFRFLKTSVYADQSWERLYSIFRKLILATVLSASAGGIYAISTGLGIFRIISWIALSIIWPAAIYLYAEFMFARRLAKQSNEELFTCPPRDKAYEKSLYLKTAIFGISFYFIVSSLVFILLKTSVR